jgi:hypothetical protein
MSLGPAIPIEPATAELSERSLRVVVTRSEIYDSVYIEEVTFGEEGCCARVSAVRSIDMAAFQESFGMHGEVAGFQFDRWLSPSSFGFTFKRRRFVLSNAGLPNVSILETK